MELEMEKIMGKIQFTGKRLCDERLYKLPAHACGRRWYRALDNRPTEDASHRLNRPAFLRQEVGDFPPATGFWR